MARTIEAFKLRTEVAVDNAKAGQALRATEKDVDHLGKRFTKLGKEINDSLKDSSLKGWSKVRSEADSAMALITGSVQSLGQTIGSIIGTAILPGIGTAIGSTVGSGVDAALGKVSGVIQARIAQGIELNKQLELTRVEFTTFAGSEQEADRYLQKLKQHALDTGTDFNWVLETSEHLFDLTGNLKLSDTILRAATDHAADFGGKVETIAKVSEALGLVAEKGSLASRELQKLYKLGIDAKKYLAQATGLTEKQIEKLMAQDRLRGDVAARLIAEGIEREKAGFAKKLTKTTTAGAERKFGVQTQLLAAEGTEQATKGIGDFYRSANQLLEGDGARQFAQFIDQTTGSMIKLVESGLTTGINVTKGLADGIVSGDALRAVGSAVTSLGSYVEDQLTTFWETKSPSKRAARVGQWIAEGLALGMSRGQSRNYANLKALSEADPNFVRTLAAEAAKRGVNPDDMLNLMGIESSFNKSVVNKWGYGGLGQVGRDERRSLGLPVGDAEFKKLLESNTASWQLQNVLFPFLDMKLKSNAGVLRDGSIDLSELYAMWGSGHATGDPNAVHMACGGKRARAYANNPLWDFNKDGIVRELEFGKAALSALGAGKFFSINDQPVSMSNPMPVAVIDYGNSMPVDMKTGGPLLQTPRGRTPDYVMQLGEEDAAIVDVIASKEALIETDKRSLFEMRQLINMSSLVPRALTPLIGAEKEHAETAIQLTEQYHQAARKELIFGLSTLNQLSGMIGQVAGFMPQQQVGKKRGFWSKVLGIAAPFLSFIPGVGPILSQVAGMTSAGLSGNWAGVVTGLSGGLQPGGAFRSSGSVGTGGAGAAASHELDGHRAIGGPGYRGRVYWTGEHGPEPFIAPDNGYFLSHHDAMRAMAGGNNNGDNGELLSVLRELRSEISRLRSMSPGDVVAAGARGLVDAMDSDAGLIRLISQRQRLA